MEDHVLAGGFGSGVLEILQDAAAPTPVERIGWPDHFIEHGTSTEALRDAHGLSPKAILHRIRQRLHLVRENAGFSSSRSSK
jgi:1-deoxy-D-xylulose-5-phosphate synthase